ncbi:helix-turn-helix transcriptional regulator [Rhizobium sp. 2MFCol3.1]|uniref:helix-turn-helix domain-containing protein n=1 Tax=Rhizobium sp. 2MFCol3.1 TaxID=1246459 RepID=UPI00036039AA|nr:helix-turn-helix transcriptional regulator [Rhizobium sp. 2MFCol3.1]
MDHINIETFLDDTRQKLGSRLREARIAREYSLEDLAIATGLTEAEISAIEDGTSTNTHHVERIEHALC